MSAVEIPYKFLVNATAPQRGSVTQSVTEQLRTAIVTLALTPGEILDKGAICARLGVSRFPVSEALARLQAEGLVEIMPQRGSMVSRVRIGDVVEYMLIRRALESEAVRALVAKKPAGLDDKLAANLALQAKAAAAGDRDTFHHYDLEFHEILFGAMQFARIRAVIENARANLDRARLLILDPRRLSMTHHEHGAIAAGIAAADADRAAAAMRAHIDKVTGELLAFAHQSPELFADSERFADGTLPFG
ncbi:MAG: GntR family transcriptional regulator [Devosia nanyangense]|uniref:GntR family transcriptional regulator n=1 Tax=Devosia nanyangense TaxID=1228055 RepID=A0A933L6E9_9HYPH|nr:GntR family transcriptional regulator [Devosia nanyangense]